MKFYIVKRDEREGDGFTRVMEFETLDDFFKFASYHRQYITEIKTLEESEIYLFEDVHGNRVQG